MPVGLWVLEDSVRDWLLHFCSGRFGDWTEVNQPWWQELLSTEFPFWLNVFPFRMENWSTYLPSPRILESTNISGCCDCLIYCEVYSTGFTCQMCFSWWSARGVHLNGTNKIPEPTIQDVTSLRDVGVTPHKNMLFQPRLWNELWRTNLWPGAQQPGSAYPRLGEAPLT